MCRKNYGIFSEVKGDDVNVITIAIAKLTPPSDDQTANFAIGKFYCFAKDDREKGLPYLTKGADEKIRELAAEGHRNAQGYHACTDI